MSTRVIVITGTDTGVGKTTLAAWLVARLLTRGFRAAALKPICSGGRDDARALHAAQAGALTLDEINPWHFRAPVAPLLAARRERRAVRLPEVLAHIRAIARGTDVIVVEGAGGLLSPLGEGFSSLELIAALRAVPVIVAANKLGALNHTLLTLAALPPARARQARVVLMDTPRPDAAAAGNAAFLATQPGFHRLPWFPRTPPPTRLARTLDAITGPPQ